MNAPRKYGGKFPGPWGGRGRGETFPKVRISCPINRSVKHQAFCFVLFSCVFIRRLGRKTIEQGFVDNKILGKHGSQTRKRSL